MQHLTRAEMEAIEARAFVEAATVDGGDKSVLLRDDIPRLCATVKHFAESLKVARAALHNDFEPDNQSREWHAINDALTAWEAKR